MGHGSQTEIGFERSDSLPFPGAIYHVLNRGNYRADVFATAGAKLAFETCVGEACAKSGWRLEP